MMRGVYTYITWPEEVEIMDDFISAYVPEQLGLRERRMIVHLDASRVQTIADRLGQKGLSLSPGEYR